MPSFSASPMRKQVRSVVPGDAPKIALRSRIGRGNGFRTMGLMALESAFREPVDESVLGAPVL